MTPKTQPVFLSEKLLLLISFLFFLLLGTLDTVQTYYFTINYGEPYNWFQRLSHIVPYFIILWVMSVPVYYLHLYTRSMPIKKRLLIHLPAGPFFGIMLMILTMVAMNLLRNHYGTPEQKDREFWEAVGKSIKMGYPFSINGFMMYWVINILLVAIEFYRKYRNQYVHSVQLESQLTQTQLRTLKMQLQPHFLFNALNTIAMMVRRKKDEEAIEMISGLSDLLRSTLNRQGEQLVTFEDELELIKKYLQIEQVRFKDKLTVSFHIQPETLKLMVPNLILQPLVENAFKYGISRSIEEAGISIISNLSDDSLHISVVNLGPVLPEGWNLEKSMGIGLSNTLGRLQQLYGDRYEFHLKNIDDTGVAAQIIIPLKPVSLPIHPPPKNS